MVCQVKKQHFKDTVWLDSGSCINLAQHGKWNIFPLNLSTLLTCRWGRIVVVVAGIVTRVARVVRILLWIVTGCVRILEATALCSLSGTPAPVRGCSCGLSETGQRPVRWPRGREIIRGVVLLVVLLVCVVWLGNSPDRRTTRLIL